MSLIYCKECGKQLSSNASVCPNCGNPQEANQKNNNGIHIGYLLIGFLIPFVGFTLTVIFWKSNRKSANSSLLGSVMGFIVTMILYSYMETLLLEI